MSRVAVTTALAMVAFAANSLLCRFALDGAGMDPASFTAVRILAGAVTLGALVATRGSGSRQNGNWISSFALFAYAAAFSFAYVTLPAGTGALVLFGAVQITMIGFGLYRGERYRRTQVLGMLLAAGGLAALLAPGATAPSPSGSLLMGVAGVAWGVYSLRGRASKLPVGDTAGNFARAGVWALLLILVYREQVDLDGPGWIAAVASGAVASGVGYAIWYAALRQLTAASAATVQLSVPVIAAVAGVLILGEAATLRLLLSGLAILGGIGLVVRP